MKFSILSSLVLAAFATAAPATLDVVEKGIVKRAAVSDPANIGYATQNGGTTGGAGGTTTTVTTLAQLVAAAGAAGRGIVIIQGAISGAAKVQVTSDKTIVGRAGSCTSTPCSLPFTTTTDKKKKALLTRSPSTPALTGIGLTVLGQRNVILRNLKISKVLADYGDAITIQLSTNVWVDHCDLAGDREVGKDTYDGLVDLSHAADFVTISHTYFHDHSKGSLVGHSDNNAAEDTGTLRVTYANNYFYNIRSRGPLLRFGTAHVYNQYYNTMDTGLNTRMNAQALIQSSVFRNVGKKAIFSESSSQIGYAVAIDVVLEGESANTASRGTLSASSFPYQYTLLGSASVPTRVPAEAGQILSF
ncbi:hypothetical protein S7711_04992 [Stachybotrys chartarum IBT 7711]|uniref:pectate lyase n=1 Tax=Stachybotrys chartarum (strain CBS 109288 / IBT 7711) TaxID=1280523 RepID=A0A084ARC5_STACB|nr:hypothetical protein S7711_04992 [Stachybotrys chartarum IBT 7711]